MQRRGKSAEEAAPDDELRIAIADSISLTVAGNAIGAVASNMNPSGASLPEKPPLETPVHVKPPRKANSPL